jgi:hypothetical protein
VWGRLVSRAGPAGKGGGAYFFGILFLCSDKFSYLCVIEKKASENYSPEFDFKEKYINFAGHKIILGAR